MRPVVLLTAGLLLVGGCGSSSEVRSDDGPSVGSTSAAPVIEELEGEKVAAMVERQLEAENPTMAPGRFTCPDLAFRVDAAVRCVRVAELTEGRRLRVLGTVTVTSLEDNGRLHVELDDEVEDFGLNGAHLEADLAVRAAERWKRSPEQVRCPYLGGEVGDRVRCTLVLDGRRREVLVEITGRDEETYRTEYDVLWSEEKRR